MTQLLRLYVKRRSAKTRQPVLTSLYLSVYMSESHSRVADALVNIYCAGQWTKGCTELDSMYTDYRFHEFDNCCSCFSWRWCRELWTMLRTVKSIHSRRALTFTACVDGTCAKLQAYKFHTGFLSTMLKNILEITA